MARSPDNVAGSLALRGSQCQQLIFLVESRLWTDTTTLGLINAKGLLASARIIATVGALDNYYMVGPLKPAPAGVGLISKSIISIALCPPRFIMNKRVRNYILEWRNCHHTAMNLWIFDKNMIELYDIEKWFQYTHLNVISFGSFFKAKNAWNSRLTLRKASNNKIIDHHSSHIIQKCF